MTLSTLSRSTTYTGNGVTVAFAIPFYWITDAHIVVQLRLISSGAITNQVLGTNYTLAGAGSFAGGTVTMTVAPSALYELIVTRTVPITQLQDYISGDTFAADTMERGLDYLTMICQQLSDSIAGLAGTGYTFQNLGTGQGHIYSGTSGTIVQLKSLKQAGTITITENASEITISSAGALDLAADYAWTGRHTWTKQAARTTPSLTLKSLQGGADIVDSSILLASDYVAAFDVRKRTDVAIEAPVDASWGGNFGIYIQHAVSGTAGANGTLTGGIRAQVETSQIHGAGSVNDAVGGYFSIYNNGTDVGGFGIHVDAYHAGAAGGSGHSTYGVSSEVFKNAAAGVAVGVMARSLGSQTLDYGFVVTGGAQTRRGMQFGTPTYANGGVQGASGAPSVFYVGIDLTWGQYFEQAIAIPRDTPVGFSGLAQAQTIAQDRTCEAFWQSSTGNWWLTSSGVFKFGVNMTTGNLFGPGTNEMLSCWDTTTSWILSCTSTNKTSNSANGGAQIAGVTATALRAADLAGFMVFKIGGTTVKVPYLSN